MHFLRRRKSPVLLWIRLIPSLEVRELLYILNDDINSFIGNSYMYIFSELIEHLLPRIEQMFEMHQRPVISQIADMSTKLDTICLEQQTKKFDVVNSTTFVNKHEIQLPVQTMEEFYQFDEKLAGKEAAKDLVNKQRYKVFYFKTFSY